jgi:hypothetical protein
VLVGFISRRGGDRAIGFLRWVDRAWESVPINLNVLMPRVSESAALDLAIEYGPQSCGVNI